MTTKQATPRFHHPKLCSCPERGFTQGTRTNCWAYTDGRIDESRAVLDEIKTQLGDYKPKRDSNRDDPYFAAVVDLEDTIQKGKHRQ